MSVRETMVHTMRWRVYKLKPWGVPMDSAGQISRAGPRWVSAPANGTVGVRFHRTHAEALQRAIVKAYGPQPRKATP